MAPARREKELPPLGPREVREGSMREALLEAVKARGRTHPNPIVGALVVKDGHVLGRGHHAKAGAPHAEVMALREAGAGARGAELFVTLEPCNHHGRTPPCTEAIVAAGIARVHVGSSDPNPHVRGGGAERLSAAGIAVERGLLGALCDAVNEPWLKFIQTGRPWVLLKAAATLDGKLATAGGDSRWVTGEAARLHVHHLRDQLDAVLVGIHTVLADDPRLTARLMPAAKAERGPRRASMRGMPTIAVQPIAIPSIGTPLARPGPARDPIRVVIDARGQTPLHARLLAGKSRAQTWIATSAKAPEARLRELRSAGAELLTCRTDRRGRLELGELLGKLGERGLTSLLVEGGAAVHGSFLRERLWDELQLFLAPKLAGADALSWAGFASPAKMADALPLDAVQVDATSFAPDLLIRARPR